MRSYLSASLAFGAICLWGSEMFFWSAPPAGVSVGELLLTWLAYSVCAAAALSAVLATGVQGWRAAFLGGAVLGWLVEGVVVDTMYSGFPFQVVWTPLAWHALVTGLLVVGLGRAAPGWTTSWRWLAWMAVGVGGGLWASYWPIERGAMPGVGATTAYLVGVGVAVPLAHLLLDRIGTVAPPRRGVLWLAPGLLLLLWLVRCVVAPSPYYLSLPFLVWLTWWVMRRLGSGQAAGLRLGGPSPARRHAVFLVAPVAATIVAAAVWGAAPDGLAANVPVALVTGVASLWLYVRLLRESRGSGSDRHHDPRPLDRVDPGPLGEPESAE